MGSPNFASSAFCASRSASTEVISTPCSSGPGDDVVGAGFDRRLEHRLVLGGLAVEDDEPDPVEHEGNRAEFRQRAARLGEIGAHLARGGDRGCR